MDDIPQQAVNEPTLILGGQEKIQAYRAQLQALPEEQREVFILKEETGLSLAEIAQTTGDSFETVKSRLRYAVKKLKQALDDNEADNIEQS